MFRFFFQSLAIALSLQGAAIERDTCLVLCTDVCYMNVRTPKDWTPLSYCKAKGKYGATEEKGIYPEVDALSLYRTLPAPYN